MGFNIAGLVIGKNFDKDIEKLSEALNWGIKVVEEINFEQASKNWTPEGEFRLYFTDKATMIFFPHEWAINHYHVTSVDSLCYAYSATAMTFIVSYLDKESNYRAFMESEGKRSMEEGQPLEYEKEHPTADGLIFKLIDVVLQDNFHQIDFADKAFRCKKVPYVAKTNPAQEEVTVDEVMEMLFGTFSEEESKHIKDLPSNDSETGVQIEGVDAEGFIIENPPKVQQNQPETKKPWWQFWK